MFERLMALMTRVCSANSLAFRWRKSASSRSVKSNGMVQILDLIGALCWFHGL
jgi:hypothetical protein